MCFQRSNVTFYIQSNLYIFYTTHCVMHIVPCNCQGTVYVYYIKWFLVPILKGSFIQKWHINHLLLTTLLMWHFQMHITILEFHEWMTMAAWTVMFKKPTKQRKCVSILLMWCHPSVWNLSWSSTAHSHCGFFFLPKYQLQPCSQVHVHVGTHKNATKLPLLPCS